MYTINGKYSSITTMVKSPKESHSFLYWSIHSSSSSSSSSASTPFILLLLRHHPQHLLHSFFFFFVIILSIYFLHISEICKNTIFEFWSFIFSRIWIYLFNLKWMYRYIVQRRIACMYAYMYAYKYIFTSVCMLHICTNKYI
jgi:hypothetical protein